MFHKVKGQDRHGNRGIKNKRVGKEKERKKEAILPVSALPRRRLLDTPPFNSILGSPNVAKVVRGTEGGVKASEEQKSAFEEDEGMLPSFVPGTVVIQQCPLHALFLSF